LWWLDDFWLPREMEAGGCGLIFGLIFSYGNFGGCGLIFGLILEKITWENWVGSDEGERVSWVRPGEFSDFQRRVTPLLHLV